MMNKGLLLDTCTILYISNKCKLREETRGALEQAFNGNHAFISTISALEIGQLSARRRAKVPADPFKFFKGFSSLLGISLCELSPEIMLRSSFLPSWRHKDPVDRILVTTALVHNLTLVTSDRAILAYGALGHVKTLAC
jgi:PIN domain nuclease of toxin-antitoxin system